MPYGRKQNDERNQSERMGVGRSGISTPTAPAEQKPNYTVQDLGTPEPIKDFYPGITKSGVNRKKAQLENIMRSAAAPQNKIPRRIGYGVAAAAGLGGLAGLLSGERERREQEAVR